VLSLIVGLLSSASLAAEELPPRAVARLGNHRFYHGPGLGCAVLSPDGRRVASAAAYPSYFRYTTKKQREAYETVIVLWDAATGARVRELKVPQSSVWRLAFSPDGKRLAAACGLSADKEGVVVFEVETGKLLNQFGDFKTAVGCLEFSTDGKRLHVSEWHGPVSAWEAATGKQLRLWKPPPTTAAETNKLGELAVEGVLSPDGKFLVWLLCRFRLREIGDFPDPLNPNTLRVHDAETEKLLHAKEFKQSLDSFAFSPDGRRIAANCGKPTIWDSATGKELLTLDAPRTWRMALAPDWRRAVIADGNSRVHLWDLEARKPSHELFPGLVYINSGTLETPQVFSADGKTLVLTTDTTLRLFDTTTGKERVVPGHRAPRITPRFSADGRTLFTTCDETRCRWDVSPGRVPVLLGHVSRNAWEGICGEQVLAHSVDGRRFLDDPEGRVRLRETTSGRVLRDLTDGGWGWIYGLFSLDATRVLLHYYPNGDKPQAFRLYDAESGKLSGEIRPVDHVGRPVFSSNGRLVAWADRDNVVHLHDALTGKGIRSLQSKRPLSKLMCNDADLLFSPDSEYLAITTYLGHYVWEDEKERHTLPTRIFHVPTGKEIRRFHVNPESADKAANLSCAAWSPDGRLLAVAEQESGRIRLIEIASGQVRALLDGHRDGVFGLAFSPDGKTLASGGMDNVTFLWDVTGAAAKATVTKPSDTDLSRWWTDLAAEDAQRAGRALASIIRTPEQCAAFLKKQLRPIEAEDEKRLARWIADLDADTFEQREEASRQLAQLGERAEGAMRRALKDAPPEAKRRLEELLDKLELLSIPPQTLRALRAVEALEHIGTAEARQVLKDLSQGARDARVTREAVASLDRLSRRDR
jgi:WD40 repeat protein